MGKGTFIMIVGLPGAGKTRFSKGIKSDVILNANKIRKELYGSEEIQGDPKDVFALMDKKCSNYLSREATVVYDATNISAFFRGRTLHRMKANSNKMICYFIDAPLEVAVARNEKRRRKVPNDVIQRMHTELERPQLSEGFHEIIVFDENFKVKDILTTSTEPVLLPVELFFDTGCPLITGRVERPQIQLPADDNVSNDSDGEKGKVRTYKRVLSWLRMGK